MDKRERYDTRLPQVRPEKTTMPVNPNRPEQLQPIPDHQFELPMTAGHALDQAVAPVLPAVGEIEIFMNEDVAHAIRIFTETPGSRPERMRAVLMFALAAASINLSVKPDA